VLNIPEAKSLKRTLITSFTKNLRCGIAESHVRTPWKAKRSNQSILKEIRPDYSLEVLMLMLQYFGHLTQKANSLEKTLMLGKIESKRRG